MTDCTLCNPFTTPELRGRVLADTGEAYAVLSPDWSVRGHAMVCSRSHVENLSGLAAPDRTEFMNLAVTLEAALLMECKADRVVLLKLGFAVPHLHWHLYPVKETMSREEMFAAFEGKRSEFVSIDDEAQLLDALRDALSR